MVSKRVAVATVGIGSGDGSDSDAKSQKYVPPTFPSPILHPSSSASQALWEKEIQEPSKIYNKEWSYS